MKVSDLFVKCLENEGVRYVFGVPGEEIEDLLFSLEQSSITFIPTRHEQGAAFMADVWGRLTGKAGVCLSTLGPGATNLVTGVRMPTSIRVPWWPSPDRLASGVSSGRATSTSTSSTCSVRSQNGMRPSPVRRSCLR